MAHGLLKVWPGTSAWAWCLQAEGWSPGLEWEHLPISFALARVSPPALCNPAPLHAPLQAKRTKEPFVSRTGFTKWMPGRPLSMMCWASL